MSPLAAAHAGALHSLRARWAFFLLAGALVLLAGSWFLSTQWPLIAAQQWLALAALVFAVQCVVLWFDLPRNLKRSGGKLLPGFGPGTWLSLLRVLALAMLAGFLWPGQPAGWLAWAPFAFLLLFNLLDLADGYAARRSGTATRLGEKLDLDLDGRGVLAASLLAFRYGAVGWWYLLVGLARYVYVFAIWARRQLGLSFEARPNRLRRPFAGAQMGIGVALLAPGLPHGITAYIAALSMIPFLGNFLYDWWVGAGWLRVRKATRGTGAKTWPAWGLFGVRLLLAAFVISRISSAPSFDLYATLDALLALGLLLGIGGRPAAFAFLVVMGLRLRGQVPNSLDYALIFLGLVLLYLGPGRISLRRASEAWLFHRAGEKPS
ncbi:MAG: CDP-alcohol phosphatidyltransferase family protein [Anaerolineales bacterium]